MMNAEQMKAYYTDAKVAELQAAFNRVAPVENWKNPINTVVTANDTELAVIREAVIFYTGSVPTFTPVNETEYRVTAAGYYATIGA